MTLEKLKRILWRLRSLKEPGNIIFSNKNLEQAIMMEIGIDKRTLVKYRKALHFLGWISYDHNFIKLTGKDMTVS